MEGFRVERFSGSEMFSSSFWFSLELILNFFCFGFQFVSATIGGTDGIWEYGLCFDQKGFYFAIAGRKVGKQELSDTSLGGNGGGLCSCQVAAFFGQLDKTVVESAFETEQIDTADDGYDAFVEGSIATVSIAARKPARKG